MTVPLLRHPSSLYHDIKNILTARAFVANWHARVSLHAARASVAAAGLAEMLQTGRYISFSWLVFCQYPLLWGWLRRRIFVQDLAGRGDLRRVPAAAQRFDQAETLEVICCMRRFTAVCWLVSNVVWAVMTFRYGSMPNL